jgi:hypothetical protein
MDNFDVCRKALSWICIDMICSHHDIAEILLKLLLNINQSIFSWLWSLRCERHLYYLAFTVFGLECPRKRIDRYIQCLSVTFDRSVVFSGYSGFLHQ